MLCWWLCRVSSVVNFVNVSPSVAAWLGFVFGSWKVFLAAICFGSLFVGKYLPTPGLSTVEFRRSWRKRRSASCPRKGNWMNSFKHLACEMKGQKMPSMWTEADVFATNPRQSRGAKRSKRWDKNRTRSERRKLSDWSASTSSKCSDKSRRRQKERLRLNEKQKLQDN